MRQNNALKDSGMAYAVSCELILGTIGSYLDGTLPQDQLSAFDSHVLDCSSCQKSIKHFRAMNGLMEYVQVQSKAATPVGTAVGVDAGFQAMNSSEGIEASSEGELVIEAAPTSGTFSAAPWWAVSVLLHVLIIALASLVSMAIAVPDSGDAVIMITDLSTPSEVVAAVEKPKTQDTSALESKHDTPPTDPTSKEASDIEVPADILAKAERGDHFETINSELLTYTLCKMSAFCHSRAFPDTIGQA